MSKLEMLSSYMMKRLAVAAREILEAVEATVTEYRAETAQTRIENEKLRQQLRELLTPVTEPVRNASKSVSEEMSSCGQRERNSSLEKPAELLEDQQNHNHEESDFVFRKKSPAKVIQACKKDPDSEVKSITTDTCTVSPTSESPETDTVQQVAVPVVKLCRVKLEQEEAKIPVGLPDTDLPKDSAPSHSYSSEATQIALSPGRGCRNASLSDAPERNGSQNPAQMSVRTSPEMLTDGVSGETVYKCSQCRRSFAEPDKLQMHQQTHKRTYGCHWCGKSFYQSADLRRHVRTHTGERPYLCTWCSKSFSQRSNLRRHVRIHTGERPYRCAHCDHSFSDSHTLKKHQRKHYEQRYSCTVCEQSFTMARSLQLHLVRQHLIDKGSQVQVGFRHPA